MGGTQRLPKLISVARAKAIDGGPSEASIRLKFQFREPLIWEEKVYMRRLAERDVR